MLNLRRTLGVDSVDIEQSVVVLHGPPGRPSARALPRPCPRGHALALACLHVRVGHPWRYWEFAIDLGVYDPLARHWKAPLHSRSPAERRADGRPSTGEADVGVGDLEVVLQSGGARVTGGGQAHLAGLAAGSRDLSGDAELLAGHDLDG